MPPLKKCPPMTTKRQREASGPRGKRSINNPLPILRGTLTTKPLRGFDELGLVISFVTRQRYGTPGLVLLPSFFFLLTVELHKVTHHPLRR